MSPEINRNKQFSVSDQKGGKSPIGDSSKGISIQQNIKLTNQEKELGKSYRVSQSTERGGIQIKGGPQNDRKR